MPDKKGGLCVKFKTGSDEEHRSGKRVKNPTGEGGIRWTGERSGWASSGATGGTIAQLCAIMGATRLRHSKAGRPQTGLYKSFPGPLKAGSWPYEERKKKRPIPPTSTIEKMGQWGKRETREEEDTRMQTRSRES